MIFMFQIKVLEGLKYFHRFLLSWNQTVGIYDLRNLGNYEKIMIVKLVWIEIEVIERSFDFKD